MSVNSIERLDEYCNIEQEAPAVVYTNRPPQSWPHEGAMTFRNVTLKYASSTEPVLHGISFNVPAHTSVGIVGKLPHILYTTHCIHYARIYCCTFDVVA
jgi:ABC-type multidrug transport system fused ATPase/permease subunit